MSISIEIFPVSLCQEKGKESHHMADSLSQPKNMQNTVPLKMRMSFPNMTLSEKELIGTSRKYSSVYFKISLDMFENCNNLYHIDFEQVLTCLKIVTIHIILFLNKVRHV